LPLFREVGEVERKIIECVIPYFEKGKDFEKIFTISRSSRRVIKDYTDILERVNTVQTLTAQRKDLIDKIAWIATDRDINRKEKRKQIKGPGEKLKEVELELQQINRKVVANDLMEVVTRLFDDNGIIAPEMCKAKWWEAKTEEVDLWTFLNEAVYKDLVDVKKKVTLN
jgi:hypothetical protein